MNKIKWLSPSEEREVLALAEKRFNGKSHIFGNWVDGYYVIHPHSGVFLDVWAAGDGTPYFTPRIDKTRSRPARRADLIRQVRHEAGPN